MTTTAVYRASPAEVASPLRLPSLANLVTPLLVVGALVSWWFATRDIDLNKIDVYGLISVVGFKFLVTELLLAGAAVFEFRRREVNHVAFAAITAAFIVTNFGLLNVTQGEASLTTGWLHVGFANYINQHGEVLQHFDVRMSWPGFFAAIAVIGDIAGWHDASPLLLLAPVVYNLLAIVPIFVIARKVCRTDRIAWLGVLLYFFGNWYEQDYLSPQASAFVLYLCVIAVLLTLIDRGREFALTLEPGTTWRPKLRSAVGTPGRVRPYTATGLEMMLAIVSIAIVLTHQLTPISLLVSLLLLSLLGGTRMRVLWLFTGIVFLGWFSYGAVDYWTGHLGAVTGSIGAVRSTLHSSVGNRLVSGNATYGHVKELRVVVALLYCVVALAGIWRLRHLSRTLLWAALAYGAFTVVFVQSYGGEIAIRAMVFAMPFLAPLCAEGVSWLVNSRRLVAVPLLFAFLALASLTLTMTRGLNAAFERVPPGVVAVNKAMDDRYQKGQSIAAFEYFGLLENSNLAVGRAILINQGPCLTDAVTCIERERPTYFVSSVTEDAYGVVQYGRPKGWTQTAVNKLIKDGYYTVVASNADAQLLQLVAHPPTSSGAKP